MEGNSGKQQQKKMIKVFCFKLPIRTWSLWNSESVKYQKRCYDKYTSFLRTTTQSKGKETEQHDFKYEKSFDVFCEEFVKEKLIKQENIFYMKKLKKEFVKTVQRAQNEGAASYQTFRLKERLRKKFP